MGRLGFRAAGSCACTVGGALALFASLVSLLSGCASAPLPSPNDEAKRGQAVRESTSSPPPADRASVPVPSLTATATSGPPKSTTRANAPLWQRRYGWADGENPLSGGATFTLVKGLTPRQVLRILAPHPATAIETPNAAARWAAHQRYSDSGPIPLVIETGRRNGWTMVLENNGFEATASASELSRAGTAVVIYNNVDALSEFQYAVHGEVLRDFEPLVYSNYGPGAPLPQERGIGFGKGQGRGYLAKSMLLAERLTGLRIEPSDLSPQRYDLAVGVMI
ncbi:MAG: hypothetical protein QOG52_57 [Frankiaceae bacterium]|nr:hypothetical protein [Frankiaceae bacterium]